MPLQATSGAASYDAFGGGGVPYIPQYIEDVFSTYLETGNNDLQTINNGIDLANKGGMVWLKSRSVSNDNYITSTGLSAGAPLLVTNTTAAAAGSAAAPFPLLSGFSSTGFQAITSTATYVSWTFREQPKFFDVVTYTGNGLDNRTIAHSLGSVPGCMIIKKLNAAEDWQVYHRSTGNAQYLVLNTTAASAATSFRWSNTTPTATVFTVGSAPAVNESGSTYVAYIFAHNAGGFGLTGTDNVISCGSYTGNGSTTGPVINLGYEPQWIMLKNSSAATDWVILDNMRGLVVGGTDRELNPNQAGAESGATYITPTATGFQLNTTNGAYNASGNTFIYIAIRRGPMRTPTTGTSVFSPNIATTNIQSGTQLPSAGFPVDLQIGDWRNGAYGAYATDRLRGGASSYTFSTGAENPPYFAFDSMTNVRGTANFESSTNPFVFWQFRRAPGFFDEVCYTGDGVNGRTITHNLSVTPELIIVKNRTTAGTDWPIRCSVALTTYKETFLNLTNATGFWNYIQNQSSTTFTVGNSQLVNYFAGDNYVAYLFASCPGVSKVGSYTGTGTTQTINCGFTAGSRFVLIKRTDSTGDWYVWDSARGIVAGNDPYLLLNSTAAEVTNTDFIDTASTGFEISSTAPAAINASGGTYIFLAIA